MRPGTTSTARDPVRDDPAIYRHLPTFAVLGQNWEVWSPRPDFQSASVGINNERIIMHPGPLIPGSNAILGWRSPVSSPIRVQASIAAAPQGDCPAPANGIAWSLDQGARTLRSGTLAAGAQASFELPLLRVTSGESLYVVVEDDGEPFELRQHLRPAGDRDGGAGAPVFRAAA